MLKLTEGGQQMWYSQSHGIFAYSTICKDPPSYFYIQKKKRKTEEKIAFARLEKDKEI
jgi:hypothetical protein